ncbi:MAG: chorismate-binding protein, partial [Spirochaetia bacterium]|nr:chorismate-binding protein [Spirochaetia bacterium]
KLPPFYGGAIGYLSYETVSYFEKIAVNDKGRLCPDGILIIPETLLAYDNMKRSVQIIESVPLGEAGKNAAEAYSSSSEKLQGILTKIRGNLSYEAVPPFKDDKPAPQALTSEKDYQKGVDKVREFIGAGEIIQAVLSQRFSVATKAPAFEIYRSLRVLNPSPYLYYLDFGDFQIVGSSPEVMVKLKNGELLLKPIAGTRKRGTSVAEDEHLALDLIRDPKERAEHLMLVDLGRNDLGRVAVPGSVEVADYMAVEKYSHVMHIVSTIRALVDPTKDAFDVIRATFPAGTLSGAPKIRAMQILAELEPVARGPYGGMILNLGFSGNMDSCITIRTLVLKDGVATLQAGAGIVADSVPEKEMEECRNKAGALLAAIEDTRRRHAP